MRRAPPRRPQHASACAHACMRNRRKGRGFSLIELLAVLAILAVLVAMAMPMVELSVRRDREGELRHALWEIRDALDAYKRMADAGQISAPPSGYPPDLQTLVRGVPGTAASVVYFLRRVPQDPFAPPAADGGWGLRSYASPPDAPAAGADVYDVYSRSTEAGLDGVPLRSW